MRYRMLRYIDGKPKAVTFGYDDGCRQDIILSQLLYKYKLKGTFNLNSDWFGKNVNDQHLTKEEIKNYIICNGHEIAVHGAQHLANGNVRSVNGIYDVLKCRLDLEREFDCIVRGMAYPDTGISLFQNNASFKKIRNYLIDLDIVYARSFNTKGGNFELPDDWHNLIPTAHHDDEKLFTYIDSFLNFKPTDVYPAKRSPKLFYLWGHSYEFDQNNNWDRIEKICQALSGKQDIWYATNIEIYNYVSAYNSLIFSANGTKIYNPSVQTVWFDIDGVTHSVNPNETLRIE